MLTRVSDSVGVCIARITILLRIIVFCNRTHLTGNGITVTGGRGTGTAERPAVTTFGLRRTALLGVICAWSCFATGWRSCFLLGCACPRVTRITNASERALPASPMWSIVVRSWCLFPQIVKLDKFRLKIIGVIYVLNPIDTYKVFVSNLKICNS
jgi:hypothetical protein